MNRHYLLEEKFGFKLRLEEEAMPLLSSLGIIFCKRLRMIPEGLKHISSLKMVKVETMVKDIGSVINIRTLKMLKAEILIHGMQVHRNSTVNPCLKECGPQNN
ncbi:hypothetical protein AMTR_s00006p00254970 [Amborella trichopoda]|uniref:Uncharacterized protein n=1 Tax=Amborella trichopoda TaxID=13333 RepID=W1PCW0_AMBTC|nr:hypothetical protein AMTR_s00006p00254970 [Amborella trichopoda]